MPITFRKGGQSASVVRSANDGKPLIKMIMQKSIYLGEDLWPAVEYVEQPLGDHHFGREDDRLHFLEVMEEFLKRHNPA
jgi:hypothetical protein